MNNSIQFGTDGIRGKADAFPFLSTPLKKLGKAFIAWAQAHYPEQARLKVLIVGDTRASFERIKEDLCAGLATSTAHIIDAGILSTPAACSILQHDSSFNLGIVISASHNPYYDNGIKLFKQGGNKLTQQDEQYILSLFAEQDDSFTTSQGIIVKQDLFSDYLKTILALFPQSFLTGITIVLDCANGATSAMAPFIFKALGAEVITLSANPSGTNINDNCGALHPEQLQQAVVQHQAFAGFAFDGDGDRIIAVNKHGELRDGDDIIWLLAESPAYQAAETVVGTIMANSGLETALEHNGKKLTRVDVGDKHILRKLDDTNLPLGGEPSGHIILRDYLPICDGIFVALRLLDVVLSSGNITMNSFKHFPQALVNIAITHKKDLNQGPCADIINSYKAALTQGRILVRYSGTENVLRIMTEATTKEQAQEIAQELGTTLKLQLT